MKRPLSDPYWFYNFFILCYLATPYFILRVFHYSNKPSISQSSSLFNHQHSSFFFSFEGTFRTKRYVPWPNVLVMLGWNMLGWKIHNLKIQVLSYLTFTIQPHVLNDLYVTQEKCKMLMWWSLVWLAYSWNLG